ncbi:MAG TPA: thermonuclease family protein [Cytophagales bacterium]|nr:thermonuclease family protein [Cytophagales bacterium]
MRCLLAYSLITLLTFDCFSHEVWGRVVKVKDGDTFVVLLDDKTQLTIRLAYIDCPEKGQPYFQKAKDLTAQMVFGSRIRCMLLKKERYQRFLAVAYLPDSTSLNEFLVRKGFAWCYKQYAKHTRMELLESKARADRLGIWQDRSPVPPWEFRKLKHKQTY